jgi:hypothetical protein
MKKRNVNKRENVRGRGKRRGGRSHGGVHELHPVITRTRQVRAII